MTQHGIARIACDGIPETEKPMGRPRKRWKESWISTSKEINDYVGK